MRWKATFIMMAALRCFASCNKPLNSFAGPFTAYVIQVNMCEPTMFNSSFTSHIFRVSHFNPAKPWVKQTVTGNCFSNVPLTDDDWIVVNMAIRSNNQWKENAIVAPFRRGACSAFRAHMPHFFQALFRESNPNTTGTCYIPPRNYILDNVPVDWETPFFKVLPYGHWMFKVSLGRKDETFPYFCSLAECKTVPKL